MKCAAYMAFPLSYTFIFLRVHFFIIWLHVCVLLFNLVNYESLLLCLRILIAIYVPFCVFCFVVLFCILLLFKCVLCCYHRLSTQLQLTEYIMFVFSQLHFMEITLKISILLCYKNVGTDHWAVSDASASNTNCTKDVNNANLTLKH